MMLNEFIIPRMNIKHNLKTIFDTETSFHFIWNTSQIPFLKIGYSKTLSLKVT